jgi:hypothetical protein
MTTPPGPGPGQSLEDWVRESLLGPLPGDPEPPGPERPPPEGPDARDPGAPDPDDTPASRPGGLDQVRAHPGGTGLAAAGPSGPVVDRPLADAATPPRPSLVAPGPVVPAEGRPPERRRAVLGAATGIAAVLGVVLVAVTPTTAPRVPVPDGAVGAPAVGSSTPGPVLASVASTPQPAPVLVAFAGRRVDVGGGWRIGVSRPYLCPVLMNLPALMSGDSRLVRMTVTLINDTGAPQQARAWTLAATANGTPVEMVLWPSAGFRGVPDRVLAPGERVRFLVAVRLPAQRVGVEVTAVHPTGVRAALTGRA